MITKRNCAICAVVGLAGIAVFATGGVDRGGVTRGVMQQGKGIVVNGVEFDPTDAMIVADGVVAAHSALYDGQIVAIFGDLDPDGSTGSASEIIYDDNVDGPVDWIDYYADDGLFTALGQLVRVTPETVFSSDISPASIWGLQVGQHLEVNGLMIDTDEIEAAYIRLQPAGSELEVTGYAQNVDSSKREFTINDLTVRYDNAELLGFLDGHPVNDNLVEARGMTLTRGGELRATHLEKKPILTGDYGTQLELDGLVSHFDSPSAVFRVAGTPVFVHGDTDFEGGNATDIADGARLRIDGHFDQDGILAADLIEFYPYD